MHVARVVELGDDEACHSVRGHRRAVEDESLLLVPPAGQVTWTRFLRCARLLDSIARSTFSVLRIVGVVVSPHDATARPAAASPPATRVRASQRRAVLRVSVVRAVSFSCDVMS
jgi:hypothetical protein